jgi:carbonic anhydrase
VDLTPVTATPGDTTPRFAVAVTCIDGRIQDAVRAQLRDRCGVEFVDAVTVPGADSALAEEATDVTATVAAVEVSLQAHDSSCVVVVGHTDCAANPVDTVTHEAQVAAAVRRLRRRLPEALVKGFVLDTHSAGITVVDDGTHASSETTSRT